MDLEHPPADCQADPDTARVSLGLVGSEEGDEQPLRIDVAEADAPVEHDDPGLLVLALDEHLDLSRGGTVFRGVAQEVLEQQLEVCAVRLDDQVARFNRQRDRPPGVSPLEGRDRFADDMSEDLRLEIDRRPGCQLGQEKQVLDDGEQPIGVIRDVDDHRIAQRLFELITALAEQRGVPEDRRHRRPQLVRDESEELVLDGIRDVERVGGSAERVLGLLALGHVDENVDRPDQLAVRVAQRCRVRDEVDATTIGSLCDGFVPSDGPVLAQRDRHRALVVAHRSTVRPEEPPRPAPLLAELGPAAPERGRGFVEEGDPPRGIGRVDGDAERLEEVAIRLLGSGRTSATRRAPQSAEELDELTRSFRDRRLVDLCRLRALFCEDHDLPRAQRGARHAHEFLGILPEAELPGIGSGVVCNGFGMSP